MKCFPSNNYFREGDGAGKLDYVNDEMVSHSMIISRAAEEAARAW